VAANERARIGQPGGKAQRLVLVPENSLNSSRPGGTTSHRHESGHGFGENKKTMSALQREKGGREGPSGTTNKETHKRKREGGTVAGNTEEAPETVSLDRTPGREKKKVREVAICDGR